MKIKFKRALLSIFLTGSLVSCTSWGQTFKYNPTALHLGKTTQSEIFAAYGKPYRSASLSTNGFSSKLLYYSFGKSASKFRNLTIELHKNKLYGFWYESSFLEDATNFDYSKVQKISKGMKEAEIIQILGKAYGKIRFPTNVFAEYEKKLSADPENLKDYALPYSITKFAKISDQIGYEKQTKAILIYFNNTEEVIGHFAYNNFTED